MLSVANKPFISVDVLNVVAPLRLIALTSWHRSHALFTLKVSSIVYCIFAPFFNTRLKGSHTHLGSLYR
jgi:hypothetical protein